MIEKGYLNFRFLWQLPKQCTKMLSVCSGNIFFVVVIFPLDEDGKIVYLNDLPFLTAYKMMMMMMVMITVKWITHTHTHTLL